MCFKVPLMNHVSKDQLNAQRTRRKALTARLNRAFSPKQQWSTIVNASAAMENSEAAVNCRSMSAALQTWTRASCSPPSHPYESPGRRPVVMGQMPYEVAHDPADDYRRQKLAKSDAVEEDARIGRRRRLCAPVEEVHHDSHPSNVAPKNNEQDSSKEKHMIRQDL